MWKHSEVKTALLLATTCCLVACGPSGGSLLLPVGSEAGADSGLTSIDIGLPDRSSLKDQVADIETKMDGYRLVVASSGTGCTNIDEVKPYATKTIAASLKQGCDYKLTLSLGNLGASAGSGAVARVSYEKDMKPLVVANCATSGCHNGSNSLSDLRTFAGLQRVGTSAVGHVRAGTMPKGGSLTAAEKKLFADWQKDGFLEKAPAASSQAASGSLRAT